MIQVLRLDRHLQHDERRLAISINPLDMTNENRKVIFVNVVVDKQPMEAEVVRCSIEGVLDDVERRDVMSWIDRTYGPHTKVAMSV